ncbi:MAG: ribosome-recycling factor, partial [Opitutales bacterium]
METEPIFTKLKEDMKRSVDHVLSEFATLHTGKANPSMVDGVTVDVYGSSMKLRDVAAITTPDSRTIQIQAWDKGTVGPIEKALIDAKLGINPIVTSELIRLPIPELSGE